ncbi:MAG: Gfo/Idh/MocA family oxidoreductase [Kiritimatiellae bacterium]|jgi:NDP-hexose-3-ketoreductase|nr:Gfo/Idh/MocA family oxidoreductase [Kiritimatiellia bacterium]
MNKIRVGVLGCANIAVRSIMPEIVSSEHFELVAVASRSQEVAEKNAEFFNCEPSDYSKLINNDDLDAIYVPLPTGLHYEWVLKCLMAGKHVLCEKSLGCNYEQVLEIINYARKQKLLVMENFQFRYHSQNILVKKMVASGDVGDIRCLRVSFGFPPFKDAMNNIRYKKELGGGALLDAGAYTLKAATFLLECGFDVKASTLSYQKGCAVDLWGAAYLESSDGVVAELAFGFDNFYQCGYEIWGSKGRLVTTRAFTAPPGFSPQLIVENSQGLKEIALEPDNHFKNMLLRFYEFLQLGDFDSEYSECLVQSHLLDEVKRKARRFGVHEG